MENIKIQKLILTTSENPPDDAKPFGIVVASCVLTKSIIQDTKETIKNLIGGELKSYSDMSEKAIEIAIKRLEDKIIEVNGRGAYAIKVSTPRIVEGASEILVIGTAYR